MFFFFFLQGLMKVSVYVAVQTMSTKAQVIEAEVKM